MLYTINFDDNNFVLSIGHTKNDNIDIDNLHEIGEYLQCCKVEGTKLVIDDTKKAEYEASKSKRATEERKAELHKLLDESDYLVDRTFEQVMSCTNPVTFITDVIAIVTKFASKYGDVIANRQTWRDELEAMEASENEQ